MNKEIDKPLSALSEDEILQKILADEVPKHPGLEEICSRLAPQLWKYLSKKFYNNQDIVEDIVAETLLSFIDMVDDRGPEIRNLRAYLIKVAHNLMVDRLRKTGKEVSLDVISEEAGGQERVPSLSIDDISPQAWSEYKEFQTSALKAIQSLPEIDRSIILLKVNYQLTFKELAEILNQPRDKEDQITPDAVAHRYYRLVSRLREKLGDRD